MYCPICGARDTGRIGRERYFCRECCHEWTEKSGQIKMFRIASNGKLVRARAKRLRTAFGI